MGSRFPRIRAKRIIPIFVRAALGRAAEFVEALKQ
jgi:hypothetical protein